MHWCVFPHSASAQRNTNSKTARVVTEVKSGLVQKTGSKKELKKKYSNVWMLSQVRSDWTTASSGMGDDVSY